MKSSSVDAIQVGMLIQIDSVAQLQGLRSEILLSPSNSDIR